MFWSGEHIRQGNKCLHASEDGKAKPYHFLRSADAKRFRPDGDFTHDA